jgi:hypothetical protein
MEGKTMTDRERLVILLTGAHNISCDASMTRCASYKEQLELEADHLLANGVTFHKWVPTALGFFPEEHGRYLCVVRSFAFPGRFYQSILQYDNYGFREGNIYTDDVAYWMPLPNLPGGE